MYQEVRPARHLLPNSRPKCALSPSQFILVDGVALHVREEGRGAAVTLLNGHLGSFHVYDAWAERLRPRYRVIQIDWAPYGLSSLDRNCVYSTIRLNT